MEVLPSTGSKSIAGRHRPCAELRNHASHVSSHVSGRAQDTDTHDGPLAPIFKEVRIEGGTETPAVYSSNVPNRDRAVYLNVPVSAEGLFGQSVDGILHVSQLAVCLAHWHTCDSLK